MASQAGLASNEAEPDARGWRVFVADTDQGRYRRATDVLLLAGSVLALAVASWTAVPPPAIARALAAFLANWPPFLNGLWQILADVSVLLGLALLVFALAVRLRTVGRDLLLGLVVAAVVSLLVGRAVVGSWPDLWESLRRAEPPPWYPSTRIALVAALMLTASPHLTRPCRRCARWTVLTAVVATMMLGGATPLGAIAGLLVGAVAAAVVHLALGSSAGRPTARRVSEALAERGIVTRSLGAADRQEAGLFIFQAQDENDRPVVVNVYGRDAHDAALLSTLWRTIWYRQPGSPLRLGRLQQVEHEALLTLLAGQAGIPTDSVVTAGATENHDALLVLRRVGSPLPELLAAQAGEALATNIWTTLDRLHRAGIAHGQFDGDHLVDLDGQVGVIDFRGATVAPSTAQRYTDQAQALLSTVLLVGRDTALRIARLSLGSDGLAAVLPLLQAPVLTPSQRRQVKGLGLDLDQLRADAATAAGTPPPELQRLQRISASSIIRVLIPAVAVLILISAAGDLNWDDFVTQLADSKWWLVALGLVAAQVPRVAQAVSTLGACPVPLPLGPVYALQLAISYINLAIPSSAARIAINIRFFQRHGIQPGTAVAIGALDGFSGFIVETIILLVLLIFTSASLELDFDAGAATHAVRILLVALIIGAVAIGAVLLVPRWRRFITRLVVRAVKEALEALRGLHSPRRLGLLLGGNLATELLFAVALGVFTRAVGYPIGLGDLLFLNISVSLLSGLLPIPGGVGVVEGALVFGLVRAGMPEEAAFAATIMYRLSNFYLPPIWGYFAMRWLQRNNHL
jgi:glycosyltransferase 2 family protein